MLLVSPSLRGNRDAIADALYFLAAAESTLSIAGHYLICMDRQTGKLEGASPSRAFTLTC